MLVELKFETYMGMVLRMQGTIRGLLVPSSCICFRATDPL